MIDDEGEETIELTGFQDFDKSNMQCAICEELKDKEFEIIFDDGKGMIDGDYNDENDVNPLIGPEIEKDVLKILVRFIKLNYP